MEHALRILQVSTADRLGGAESVARRLVAGYRTRGHRAWLAVGRRLDPSGDALLIPNDASRTAWARLWLRAGEAAARRAAHPRLARALRIGLAAVGDPVRAVERWLGHEDFHYPGSRRLLDLCPEPADLIHLHNLHGGYFDLRHLPQLSRALPVVLTLHDSWLLTGHCAHSFGCDRWIEGCGRCPDLTIFPSVRRDATAYNWRRKRALYRRSRLYVATPSRWLMQRVERSMLAEAAVEARVIPNGIDLERFSPGDRSAARAQLGLPTNGRVLLFVAPSAASSPWKDHPALIEAVARMATPPPGEKRLLVCLGESRSPERAGETEVAYPGFVRDSQQLVAYYRAADLYVHATRADTFPTTVMEALACGTPVVASAVGGIPEQVRGLALEGAADGLIPASSPEEATGMLVPPADPQALAVAISHLLTPRPADLLARLGASAARDARERFSLTTQIGAHLAWYETILEARRTDQRSSHQRSSRGASSHPGQSRTR